MSILNDLATELGTYVRDSVSLAIVDVQAKGTQVNVDEVCPFKAQIKNYGKLGMTAVSLTVSGLNGTQVSTSSNGPWSLSLNVNTSNVPPGAVITAAPLFFKAPSTIKPALTTLVKVEVKEWKGDMTLMNTSSVAAGPSSKVGHYNAEVFPS